MISGFILEVRFIGLVGAIALGFNGCCEICGYPVLNLYLAYISSSKVLSLKTFYGCDCVQGNLKLRMVGRCNTKEFPFPCSSLNAFRGIFKG